MKNVLACLLIMLSVSCFANNSSYFTINEEAINTEFSELNTLENAVLSNPEITVDQAVEMNLLTLAQSATIKKGQKESMEGSFMFEWEGFLWGFLCCPVGLFTVAVNKHKSRDTKLSYWIGVGAGSVMSLMYQVALAATYTTY